MASLKILFLNDPPQAVREEFYTQNWQIDILKNIDDLPEIIADYDALVIKEETNLDSELLAKARNLKVLGIFKNVRKLLQLFRNGCVENCICA